MDDDAEFRDIIVKSLENNGVLQKMRAKLRAHIYNLVDEDMHKDSLRSTPNKTVPPIDPNGLNDTAAAAAALANNQTITLASGEDESIALSLVQDLLDCLNLQYTSSVLKAELRQSYAQWPRRRIADVLQLDLDETVTDGGSAADPGKNAAVKDQSDDAIPTTDTSSITPPVLSTPLLVEILRRLPKTTDESTTKEEDSTSAEHEIEDINNDTFVTTSRSANMTSESL